MRSPFDSRPLSRFLAETRDVVYLVTAAGFPNFGDELITEAWLRHLAMRRPFTRVVVDSPHPGQSALLLRRANRRAVFVDTVWRLTNSPADLRSPALAETLATDARSDVGAELLLRARTVHIVGGGFLTDLWPRHRSLVAIVATVARTTGARAIATGAGLTPGFTGSALDGFHADAEQFDVFDVRDRPSADFIGPLSGATSTGDDAWLSPRVAAPGDRTHSFGELMLCIQGDLTADFAWRGRRGPDALTAFVRATLDEWRVPGSDVTVVECNPGLDLLIADRLGSRLGDARRVPFRELWESGLPTGGGRTWLSTRFHPHLVAASAGDSGVAVIPRPDYYGAKHGSLIAAGSAWTVVSGDADVPAPPTAGGFTADAAAANRSRKQALANRLYPRALRLH
ncbi:polysaccharide pyruvyl transferase family protein [Gordonia neofelifaecis]|uniref:Polysaccharide pyruvyl transferase domain-containing protein n=1 Tax=Gordonia neofelifaecis NRRL B-59395 TaxID=644548 RepID=F1YNF7_9ACTN|nr:polysaccharide pyruvyl transferase family protein [Gordonia neofelifaecis]EGD53711.1 hypothetical protein SCNU_17280 [Gordonia neofelifaecis NRRL B-59395]